MEKIYTGIGDAHGLESFVEVEKAPMFALKYRVEANRHRHAVLYKAELSEDAAKQVQRLFYGEDFIGALKLLKKLSTVIKVEKSFSRSWEMIPNPDLDSYWSP